MVKVFAVLTLIFVMFDQNGQLFASSPQHMPSNPTHENEKTDLRDTPHSAAERVDKTIYSKQLINDSTFDLSPSVSPWNSSLGGGEPSDVNAKIENNQCNSTIIGDTRTVSIIANFSAPGEWTAMSNPQFPTYPQWETPPWHDSYGNDTIGLWANHTWVSNDAQSTSNQRPSINWARNISLPVNMSDYEITSVSIYSQVNASVDATGTYGLEVSDDSVQGISTGDYARFYMRVSDLARTNVYELAYNRTNATLGLDSHSNPDLMPSVNMTTIPENFLIAYLTSALSQDFKNFTIILGIDFWAENNQPTERDRWNMMRINTLNLTFTLQKKINYNSFIAWNETGFMINSTDYLGSGNFVNVDVLNATLNFNYMLTQNWPINSPNSEIRVYINNHLHTETIKINNGTIWSQSIKNGTGFDVSSLISLNQNVTIRLQILMLDDFLLAQNCSVLIDDVNLTVYFEATVTTTVPDTQLKLVGASNIAVPWNDNFTVRANYTIEGGSKNGDPIAGANITIGWIGDYKVTDLGDGTYNITCNTTLTSANQKYTLQIWADAFGNESQYYSAEIQITGRPTNLYVFLNEQDLTSDPEITATWNQTVNITAFYYDVSSTENLTDAQVEISGTDLNPLSYNYSPQGTGYEFLVNSSYYEVGSHYISLAASLGNYSFASKIVTMKVTGRSTFLKIFRNTVDVTKDNELDVPLTGIIELDLTYHDTVLNETLNNYEINLQGLDNPYYFITPGITTNVVIYTTGLELGVYLVSLVAGKENYTELSNSYQINVNQIPSLLTAEHESITIETRAQFSIKVTFAVDAARMGTSGTISGATVSYYWTRGEGTLTDNGDGSFGIQLDGPLNPGAYKITITALKDNYELQTITIDLIVQSPITEDLIPLIIALITGLVGFAVAFLAYLLYFRYPAVVRKIRKVRGKMAKGATTKVSSHPKKRIFVENLLKEHGANIPPEARTKLKTEYLQLEKEEPLDRKIPEEFAPKTIVVQELEPAKAPPTEKAVPKPAPKLAAKTFEKPQQVDFGKKPEVKTLASQKPDEGSAKPVGKISLEEQINKIEQEAKKPKKERQDSNNKAQG